MSPQPAAGGSLKVRTLSACVFVPGILLLAHAGGGWLLALVALIVGRSSWELFAMARTAGSRAGAGLGSGLALGVCLLAFVSGARHLVPFLLGATLLVMAAELPRGTAGYAARTGLVLGGVLYTGLLGSAPLLIAHAAGPGRQQACGRLLGLLFLCIWLTDALAYLAGRRFGRRKLVPSISPAKTVCGAAAGLAGGLLPGLLWRYVPCLTCGQLVGLLCCASVAGQTGDLVESALKRDFGVKDAPALIPGHGGALDRFDSYLFAFPVAYLYLQALAVF